MIFDRDIVQAVLDGDNERAGVLISQRTVKNVVLDCITNNRKFTLLIRS